MGDRANIVIENSHSFPHPVFFYTHWSGSEIKPILKAALMRGKGRWNDPQYLARIIFNEMTRGSEMDETGFGISTAIGDGYHRCLFVDMEKLEVRTGRWETGAVYDSQKWTFEEFCQQPDESEEED